MARIAIIGLVGRSMFFEVPRFHSGGETVTAKSLYEEWGGKGFNQAVAAARQDAAVSFLGAVNAADAKALKDFCAKEGVRATLAAKKKPTATAAILTDGTGETRVTVYPGAELEQKDVDGFAGSIATADFLLLNNEVPEAVNLAAVEIAKQYDVKVIFNPAPSRKLSQAILEAVSIFTPNEFEEESLELGAESLELRAESLELRAKSLELRAESLVRDGDEKLQAPSSKLQAEVITTLGAKGCRVRSTGEVIPAPAAKAVDSTGAGDTFNAVLAVRLAEGETLRDACVAANAAAAQSVAVRYVIPSLPFRTNP